MQKQDNCGCLFCAVLLLVEEEDWTDARPESGNESRDWWRWGGIYPLYVRTVPRSKLIWRDSDRSPGNVPHLNERLLSGGGGSSRVYLRTYRLHCTIMNISKSINCALGGVNEWNILKSHSLFFCILPLLHLIRRTLHSTPLHPPTIIKPRSVCVNDKFIEFRVNKLLCDCLCQ